jgi:hypothetical protein
MMKACQSGALWLQQPSDWLLELRYPGTLLVPI